MATPVAAAGAYASIAKITAAVPKPPGIGTTPASFTDVLKQALTAVHETGQKSDAQTNAAVRGKGNMIDVVTAVSETEVAIDAVVAVRDKVIAAYEDILKMPI
jgi:flagellar hook-basal body complex protein FliE